jgi:hypothetical protein
MGILTVRSVMHERTGNCSGPRHNTAARLIERLMLTLSLRGVKEAFDCERLCDGLRI